VEFIFQINIFFGKQSRKRFNHYPKFIQPEIKYTSGKIGGLNGKMNANTLFLQKLTNSLLSPRAVRTIKRPVCVKGYVPGQYN